MTIIVYHSLVTARRIFANVLGKMSPASVHILTTEDEAIQAASDHAPDLIIVEKNAAQTREYRLLKQLQTASKEGRTSLMIIGYQFTEEEAVGAIRQGADNLMLLPFEAEDFLANICELVPGDPTY